MADDMAVPRQQTRYLRSPSMNGHTVSGSGGSATPIQTVEGPSVVWTEYPVTWQDSWKLGRYERPVEVRFGIYYTYVRTCATLAELRHHFMNKWGLPLGVQVVHNGRIMREHDRLNRVGPGDKVEFFR
jgi:hypothetical protein